MQVGRYHVTVLLAARRVFYLLYNILVKLVRNAVELIGLEAVEHHLARLFLQVYILVVFGRDGPLRQVDLHWLATRI